MKLSASSSPLLSSFARSYFRLPSPSPHRRPSLVGVSSNTGEECAPLSSPHLLCLSSGSLRSRCCPACGGDLPPPPKGSDNPDATLSPTDYPSPFIPIFLINTLLCPHRQLLPPISHHRPRRPGKSPRNPPPYRSNMPPRASLLSPVDSVHLLPPTQPKPVNPNS